MSTREHPGGRDTPVPLPVLALTLGDPVGIGPEVVARAVCDPRCSASAGRS